MSPAWTGWKLGCAGHSWCRGNQLERPAILRDNTHWSPCPFPSWGCLVCVLGAILVMSLFVFRTPCSPCRLRRKRSWRATKRGILGVLPSLLFFLVRTMVRSTQMKLVATTRSSEEGHRDLRMVNQDNQVSEVVGSFPFPPPCLFWFFTRRLHAGSKNKIPRQMG